MTSVKRKRNDDTHGDADGKRQRVMKDLFDTTAKATSEQSIAFKSILQTPREPADAGGRLKVDANAAIKRAMLLQSLGRSAGPKTGPRTGPRPRKLLEDDDEAGAKGFIGRDTISRAKRKSYLEKTLEVPPNDWTLKSSITFNSPKSFRWCNMIYPRHKAEAQRTIQRNEVDLND